jgi:hypothetical protein
MVDASGCQVADENRVRLLTLCLLLQRVFSGLNAEFFDKPLSFESTAKTFKLVFLQMYSSWLHNFLNHGYNNILKLC